MDLSKGRSSQLAAFHLIAPIACMKVRVFIMEDGDAFSWLRDVSKCLITCSKSCC